MSTKETKTLSFDEMIGWLEGSYRVTTIIPYVNDPKCNIYTWSKDELADFLEGYGEFAEFIVDITRIDNILVQ